MGGLHMAGDEDQRSILMSAATRFQDHQGRMITVTSHRRNDDNFEMRRRHAPANTYFAVLRETAGPGELRGLDEPPPRLPSPPIRAPRPTREFPIELTNAAVPALISPSAAVDVVHRGRFDEDGGLRGTVAGAFIDLALELPRSASSATGRLNEEPVNVAWRLSDNSGGDPKLPATLQGTVGERQVALRGVFRLAPGYWFDRASIEGTLAGVELTASIERASGGFGGSSTVVANGSHGDQEFEVFGSVNGSLDRGILRGTYHGQAIHLDARETDSGHTRISGSCPSPASFALLLIAPLIFFV
jgi:hypothetical protein